MTATTGKIETGVVDIRGKQYQTVALRVQMFREKHPDYSLVTEVIERDPECVVMKAIIGDANGRVIATGHSEEYRKASQINRTSALENAETSAIGRALAALGFGGTEFATANEVANAIHQQAGGGQSNKAQGQRNSTVSPAQAFVDDATVTKIISLCEAVGGGQTQVICKAYKVDAIPELTPKQAQGVITRLNEKLAEKVKSETNATADDLGDSIPY